MRTIGRILNWISIGCALLGAAAIILMMLQIAFDVLLKNLFTLPIPLTATLVTKWYMVAIAFLPLGMSELLDRHISVEIFYQRLNRHWRRILGGLVCLFSSVVVFTMTVPMWQEAMLRMEAGSFIVENSRSLIVWPTYFFLPVGFAVFGAVLLYRVVVLWSGLQSGMGEVPIDVDHDPADMSPSEGA